jgi:mRNA interferase MazF
MTTYEFGEVILVPFPFVDQATIKKRPAVVISSQDYNFRRSDLILIAISSQVRTPLSFCEIEISNWSAAGLLKSSVIKPVITTIDQNLVLRQLGKLQSQDQEALEHLLQSILKK